MGSLSVITSQSLTRLAAALSTNLLAAPAGMFERETVVVLNTGMARWISMELAVLQGVSAGLDYRFPNDVIDSCFRALLPSLPAASPFTRDAMAWRIAARLPGLCGRPGFRQIAAYLGGGTDDRRLLQIARTLSDLFDQYIIFRPEMIRSWDRGQDSSWQAVLWRELAPDHAGLHRAALLEEFRTRIAAGERPGGHLPRRISLFGISYLPPFHLEAFALLAQFCDITFYLQNPCGDYWGDIVSRRRMAELALKESGEAEDYYDTGNPLLSSLGTMGQEFHDLLLEFGFSTTDLDNAPELPGTTLLRAIQRDIRLLRDSGGRDEEICVDAADRSLQVHSCHGPLREMEVLYDNLLAMFDEITGLEPRQVAIMIPDIEAYAPYITAVFGGRSGGRPAIPFTVADRSQRHENPLIETFFRILGLPANRFGVNQVLELLETPAVMARFAMDSDDLERIRTWVRSTSVRWGLDAGQRIALGFPDFDDFSWHAALQRLFLGYALEPANERLYSGVLPFSGPEGRSALPLGKLAEFLAAARAAAEALSRARTLTGWADTLAELTRSLIQPDQGDAGLAPLFSAFQSLREAQTESGFSATLNLNAIQDSLAILLDETGGGFGFLGGRVTFCAMLPMRSIPFRVICLAGMNDGVFPRTRRQPAFSMMAGRRRRGDRSLRDEDRYLFLETIMAAQERLYISYTGQSDRDNTQLPPSVVVNELLDYVKRGFTVSGAGNSAPAILTRHRLQAFSPDYFGSEHPDGLFSYARDYRDALQARLQSGAPPRFFMDGILPADPLLLQNIGVSDLVAFLSNPARHFLAKRLNIRPHNPDQEQDEREPFALDKLAAYTLRQELVEASLLGSNPADRFQIARAKGLLPPLAAGQSLFAGIAAESSAFAAGIAPLLTAELEPLAITYSHDGMTLSGSLKQLTSIRNLRWRCAAMKARDRLSLWIEHLLLNAFQPSGYPRSSLLICRDGCFSLAETDNAVHILNDLLELYREGLGRPLPFFPQVSWLFATEGSDRARESWSGSAHSPVPAESDEPSVSLCFGGRDPLDAEFEALALRIFGPLLAASAEGEQE